MPQTTDVRGITIAKFYSKGVICLFPSAQIAFQRWPEYILSTRLPLFPSASALVSSSPVSVPAPVDLHMGL